MIFEGKRILVTGGTGSLGQFIVRKLLSGTIGRPEKIVVFSRDESKQHAMRLWYLNRRAATDEVFFNNSEQTLVFHIGDVRDYAAVFAAMRGVDVVIHTAALKHVPVCEYFPFEAVQTNVVGTENIIRAIREHHLPVEVVVGVSTDKACKPVNVMGMTKAVQERMLIQANLGSPHTRFVCVRYGNVIGSRGSVIPLFIDQIQHGGPITITTAEMTRFLISLPQALDTVLTAINEARPGEIYVPLAPAARVADIAEVLIAGRNIETIFTGIRPGEKTHEILVSEEECHRAIQRNGYYVILPMLQELRKHRVDQPALAAEYSSADTILNKIQLKELLSAETSSAHTS